LQNERRAFSDELSTVVLSHGHPDIFFGVKTLSARFPEAKFVVADAAIVEDIVEMAKTMEQYKMLSSPDLAADAFDYRKLVSVMPKAGVTLPGTPSVTLEPWVTNAPSEFTRITTFWMPEIDTLFASDLAYNHVHAWAGLGVDRKAIASWRGFLDDLVTKHAGSSVRVITGHGPSTDGNVLLAQRAYLGDLENALDAGLRGDTLEAEMKRRYPGHRGAEFQLHMTATNPAYAK
jgi:glyoxylase-like metal-dependent hydrolase (beta-lactamase superfamily II)